MSNNVNHMDNLQPFSKGDNRINREGRPKKIFTILKESGYSSDDMKEAFNEIGWQTVDQAKEMLANPDHPLIIKVVAHAFLRGAEKGDYRYISEIVDHIMGRATEKKEIKGSLNLNSVTVEHIACTVAIAHSESEITE